MRGQTSVSDSDQQIASGFSRAQFLRMSGAALLGMALAPLHASHAAAKEAGRGTRLILLGTGGGPILQNFRSQPATLLVVEGMPYLIDAGYGCLRQLVAAGFSPTQLAALFITHHHIDHNADLASVISFNWFGRRKSKLPIYGPFGTQQMTTAAFDYLTVGQRVFNSPIPVNDPPATFVDAHDVTAGGVIYQDERVRVTAAENSHYQLTKLDKDKSWSLRFDTAGRSVVFTGDTGESEAVVRLAANADVLVSEVVDVAASRKLFDNLPDGEMKRVLIEHMEKEHLPAAAVGKLAAAARVKMVVLSHIVPGGTDASFDAQPLIAEVKRHYDGPVIAGRDLLEL